MTVHQVERPSLLTDLFGPDAATRLLSRDEWHPYPTIMDRAGWDELSADARAGLVKQAEGHLGYDWPAIPATLFLEFARNGNRSRLEAPHFERRQVLMELVLGECVENKGRFLDDIINGIWAICEESFWGVSAHSYSPRFERGLPDTGYPVVDLFAAETGACLAWTHYLIGSALDNELPVVTDRIRREIDERILTPYRTVDDWVWLGIKPRPDRPHPNNWNPWIHSNILICNLLLEPDADTRARTVTRVITGLDAFLAGYHADGGCDEGTMYWGRAGASLFDCLDLLLSASDGALDAFGDPLVQEIGRYIYRMHIGGSWYVNFADGPAKGTPPIGVMYHYGKRINDPKLMAQAAEADRERASNPDSRPSAARPRTSFGRELPLLFDPIPADVAALPAPLVREAWLDGIEVLAAREHEGSTDGLFLAVKGGNNNESHNHNDVGHFIVGLDGQPVLIDVGVETYRRQTFSDQRYEIWTMQSAYHNLPTINGHQQLPGDKHVARDVQADITDDQAELSLDIAAAYGSEAGVGRWHRTVRLERGENARVIVEDQFALAREPETLTLSLMAADEVDTSTPGVLRCAGPGRGLEVRYDAETFRPEGASIAIDDARLSPVWGDSVSRVVLHAKEPAVKGLWHLEIVPA